MANHVEPAPALEIHPHTHFSFPEVDTGTVEGEVEAFQKRPESNKYGGGEVQNQARLEASMVANAVDSGL